ncbi:Hypothetical predicted protein [Mytilus galloprovincialis]|uniref:glutamyl aminopeptidase n=1 Tax=Mytilus galloprovincialis TaxID=29158 RepID=A0A8B6HTI9_MYTGA|nr:Hypothetical predicted protein [Mytilus galloprovincialis]
MMLKILLLFVLVEYTLQGRYGRVYNRHQGHNERYKGHTNRYKGHTNRYKSHNDRYKGISSWSHSNRYRGTKTTQYYRYRQREPILPSYTQRYRYGPGKPTVPPSTTTPTASTTPPGGGDVRLALNLYPLLYDLEIQPYIYEINPADFYFKGKVKIEMECRRSTNEIVLHSNKLNITTSSVTITPMSSGQSIINPTIEFDTVNQFLILKSTTQFVAGSSYSVYIEFRGPILSNLAGLYQSSYQRGNDTIYIASTQMQPSDARRVLPCFDEPAIKARFRLTLIRKQHFISLSNMNQIGSTDLANDWIADRYADTPLMSTYLLAMVVCDFTFIERTANNILYKAWARTEAINQTTYALDVGVRILAFFEEYFATSFPLPKQDMIAVPEFLFGAMENWGLVVYKEKSMLYDPLDTAEIDKQFVTMVISHELAHMWFGNLVTPAWWDDLWLNEGFANYIAFVGMDFIYKDWLLLDHFVVSSVHRALSFDGLISSHPIYVPVSGTAEIFSIFDSISYEKGGSVIRMMQFFLGDETFKRGMQLYITEKAYSVATHDDLWDALGRQSVKDGKPQQVHDVKRIMDTWTLQMNYPTVFMERIGNDIKLSQSRYLRDKNATDPGKYISTFGYKWEIPVTLTTQTSKNFNQNDANIIWMGKDGSDVLLSGVISGKCWYIGNIRQYGFYRVNYPEDNWIKLIDQLKMDHTIIHPVNRAQIINDAWNFAKSGDLSLNIALKTVEYLSMEDSYFPFYAANVELKYVRDMLERTELYGNFSAFMKKTFSIPLDRIGYNHTGSGHLETLLRSLVVEGACAYGDTNCINIAVSSFQNLMQATGPNNPFRFDKNESAVMKEFLMKLKPLTTSADNTEVEASMNDLAFLETSESFTVTATPTNPQPGTLLTITFNSERGGLGGIQIMTTPGSSGETLAATGSQTTSGSPSGDFLAVLHTGLTVPSPLISPTASAQQVETALSIMYGTRCSKKLKNPEGKSRHYTFETSIPTGFGGLLTNKVEPFCGQKVVRNPVYLFRDMVEASKGLFLTTSVFLVCFAYRGNEIQNRIRLSYTYQNDMLEYIYTYYDVSVTFNTDEGWHLHCLDMKAALSQRHAMPKQPAALKFYIKEIRVFKQGIVQEFFIDDVYIGRKAPVDNLDKVNEYRILPSKPNDALMESVSVVSPSIGVYEITFTPHDCGYDFPALTPVTPLVNGGQVAVSRTTEASPPLTGTYDVEFNGETVTGIDYSLENELLADELETIPGIGNLGIKRSGDCANFQYDITFLSRPGDVPPLNIDGSDINGVGVVVTSQKIEDGGLWFGPIFGEFLRTFHVKPQVSVVVNDIPSLCDGDCTFEWSSTSTPSLTQSSPFSG